MPALLRRIRRTAAVRARSELELQALGSDDFRFVVLGCTASASVAGKVVDTILDRMGPRQVGEVAADAAALRSERLESEPDDRGSS